MASNTKSTETKRLHRHRQLGRERKKQLAKKGTTRTESELFGNELTIKTR